VNNVRILNNLFRVVNFFNETSRWGLRLGLLSKVIWYIICSTISKQYCTIMVHSMIKLSLFELCTENRGGCIGGYGVTLYDVTPPQPATKINNTLQQ
jgi:hypothetical protein